MSTKNQQDKNIDLWADALESEKYTQGTGQLEGCDGEFCCLGVACKVYEEVTGEQVQRRNDGTIWSTDLGEHSEVMKWLGISNSEGAYDDGSLVNLNDNAGYDFKEIAELIRSRPKGLFKEENKEDKG